MGEDRFYKPLCEWLEREKDYYCGGGMEYASTGKERWYINTGSQKQKVDIAGIKNVGTRHFDQIDTVAVEVRDVQRITMRDLQDAHGYSNMVHHCYLATTAEPTKEDGDAARRMGVGLIHILRKDKYREIVEAQFNEPNPADLTEFLRNLWVIQCTLCRCYAFSWENIESLEGKSYFRLKRARQFDYAIYGSKNSAFEALENKELESEHEITRYICRSCVEDLTKNLPRWSKTLQEKE